MFGIPIVVKDHLPTKGFFCTMGLAARLDKKYNYDCEYIRVLKE
jgi:Asp-tRNA(Asn)/Glu-tRNA(Gln) amidotransferase A subunit family amidase